MIFMRCSQCRLIQVPALAEMEQASAAGRPGILRVVPVSLWASLCSIDLLNDAFPYRTNSTVSKQPDQPPESAKLTLFPEIEPYDMGWLSTGDGHEVYYEQCGNPNGLPVLFLHGGPASGCSPRHRRFYDPAKYRICLFDQRGSGRSRPHGERANNSTDKLIVDIEALRKHWQIDRWLVFGGSWGSALALAYAGRHTSACLGLILRGIFMSGQDDMDWFFEHSAQLIPDAWRRFSAHVGQTSSRAILAAYADLLEDGESPQAEAATAQWLAWETALSSPGKAVGQVPVKIKPEQVRQYRLHAAYLKRLCDLDEPRVTGLRVGDFEIETAADGGAWVRYAGEHRARTLSAVRVFANNDADLRAEIEGRLILIGALGVAAGFVLARTFALYRTPLMIHWLDAPPLC